MKSNNIKTKRNEATTNRKKKPAWLQCLEFLCKVNTHVHFIHIHSWVSCALWAWDDDILVEPQIYTYNFFMEHYCQRKRERLSESSIFGMKCTPNWNVSRETMNSYFKFGGPKQKQKLCVPSTSSILIYGRITRTRKTKFEQKVHTVFTTACMPNR